MDLEKFLLLPDAEKLRVLGKTGNASDPIIREQLAEVAQTYDRNPLQRFRPYVSRVDGKPKQADFLRSRARTKALFGGDRSGKTEIGIVDDLIQCLPREFVPKHLQEFKFWEPPFYCRVVFPKFGQGDLAVMEKLRQLCPKEALRGDSFDKALEKQPNLKLHFKCGSWIVFNTGDQDRDVHAGVALHRVHFDEEPQGEAGYMIYQENRSRLVDFAEHPGSQMVFTMTPKNGLTWAYDEVWDRRDNPDTFVIGVSMYDNPHLPLSEVKLREAEMSEEEARMAVYGEFFAFGGRVMDVRQEHLIDPPKPEFVQALDVSYVVIDPGWRQGGVVFGGFDGEDRLFIYDELYPSRKTADVVAQEIFRKNQEWGIDPLYLIDPAAKAGNMVTGSVSVETAFMECGIYPSYGQNDRFAGAMQLRRRLQARVGPSKTPGLMISKACTNLLYEANRWVVVSDEDQERQKAKIKGAGGSFATMGPDHLGDGVRYLSMERPFWAPDAITEKQKQPHVFHPGRANPLPPRRPEPAHPHGAMF